MRLNKISISNFHGIDDCEINFQDFTTIIGQNNCGKSTVLRAIDVFLNQIRPDADEWRRGFEEEPIIIIGEFDELEDWERNVPGISGLVNNDQIKLRYTSRSVDGKIVVEYDAYIQEYDIAGWSDRWPDLSEGIKEIANEVGINSGLQFRSRANKERVRQYIVDNHDELVQVGDEIWTNESISIPAALKQGLPQVVFIPAVRDANDEIKGTAKSTLGILISKLILPAIEQTEEYQNVINAVAELSTKLSVETEDDQVEIVKELMSEISDRLSSIISARALLSMNEPDTGKLVGSNTIIRLDDGTETSINHQGHGMQRSFLFALIETLANREANGVNDEAGQIRSSILLFEEPELYLHPHLMRRLKNALKNISYSPNWQVISTTHSPVLINVVDKPKSLVIMQKKVSNEPPIVFQLDNDPFNDGVLEDERQALRASLDFHPTVNEAFFAKRVVLVEGDTEMALFNHMSKPYQKYGISDEEFDNTTIISCGGKWTIPPIAILLCKFCIPFRIIHDVDRKEKTDEELEEAIAIHPFKANIKILESAKGNPVYPIDDTFEHILWDRNQNIPSSKGKPFGTWIKIRDFLNVDSPVTIHNERELKNIFNFVYKW